MNKKIFSLLIGMAMIIAGMTLASCGGDDDDEYKVSSHVISFQCQANDALLAIADLTVTYTDANGNTQSEPLTGTFSKTITVKKFPAQGAFKVKATLKEYIGKNKTPKLSYTYTCDNSSSSSDISALLITTKTEINELLAKINDKSWTWEVTSSGVLIHN